ncbi:hypothetical protein QR680_003828 [Steinernema hermaphroditum]|uniref:Uncharacterized protein n=1 Tax=Steinernema hermaphroditum TaxID=289476 RepID=A0AA39HLP6_9BILA|nr:hypothetical protein QR680_003828 [Steinernema hermaphroditum]
MRWLAALLCLSILAAAEEHPRQVACSTTDYGEAPKVARPFHDVPLHYVTVAYYFDESETWIDQRYLGECNADGMGEKCRRSYHAPAYAVALNKTMELEVHVPYYIRDTNSSMNETEKIEMNLFDCIRIARAPRLEAPKGSWSDTLILKPFVSVPCMPKDEWLKIAREDWRCGKTPTNYTFGGHCAQENTFYEMSFVCDGPQTMPLRLNEKSVSNQEYENSKFKLLQLYAEYAVQRETAMKNNDTWSEAALQKKLNSLYHRIYVNGLEGASFEVHGEVVRYAVEQSYDRNVTSAREEAKTALLHLLHKLPMRSVVLLNIATGLLISNHTEHEMRLLEVFNVERVSEAIESVNGQPIYKEYKDEIVKTYIDYCKNHTLGIAPKYLDFLAEPNAHKKIFSIYTEIFSPGLVDHKYLEKEEEERDLFHFFYGIAFLVPIVVFAISMLLTKSNKIGDAMVSYNRLKKDNSEEEKEEQSIQV